MHFKVILLTDRQTNKQTYKHGQKHVLPPTSEVKSSIFLWTTEYCDGKWQCDDQHGNTVSETTAVVVVSHRDTAAAEHVQVTTNSLSAAVDVEDLTQLYPDLTALCLMSSDLHPPPHHELPCWWSPAESWVVLFHPHSPHHHYVDLCSPQ